MNKLYGEWQVGKAFLQTLSLNAPLCDSAKFQDELIWHLTIQMDLNSSYPDGILLLQAALGRPDNSQLSLALDEPISLPLDADPDDNILV
jgi:hypothetical protein